MTPQRLATLAFGHQPAQILYAAVRLGVPDALAGGPLPVAELGGDPAAMARLVSALTLLGIVTPRPDGRVALADGARPLCADHPESIRAGILLAGDPAVLRAWAALPDAVRTGGPAFEHAHGRPLFQVLAERPELSALFGQTMRENSGPVAAALPALFDFGHATTVVDVGGGHGSVLAAVLAAAPGPRGVLFDTVTGAASAPETLGARVPPDRWTVRTGDFFAGVPEGDVLILKGILHDWDDDRCVRILKRCRAALAPDGRLLVLETVLPASATGPPAYGPVMGDLAMLVWTGGRERTGEDFARLLGAAGFTVESVGEPIAGTAVRLIVAV
ncbi:methyltransferase [Actinoplanes sp. NPDC020271]|uniref:methyltransferase n=1 Tax=Actinoplanes sp. NPDC020271 TaxID=3363896 RepID=UPI003798A45D